MSKNLQFQEEWNLDSSLSETLDKTLNIEEYKERVISLLTPILQERFVGNPSKQNIKVHRDRINFACPYCGDSMQSSHKKRGNIILEGKHSGFFKCFNCGEFKRVDRLFKDYKANLDLDVINYISDNLGNFSTATGGRYDVSLLMDLETIERYAIDRSELKQSFGLVEAKESPIWSWLTKRLQYTADRFLYSPSKNYILILNLTPSGKILGSQKRLFRGDNKYLTFSCAKLNELMGRGEVHDEVDMISQMFGILQLNFNLPITIFEGPFDSFLFKNSIANAGANRNFPIDIPVRYWFDDDKTGRDKSLIIIERGDSVFLWDKLKRDMQLPYRKKWDLNDLMIWARGEGKQLPSFESYFSKDPLDAIDI